MSRPTTRFVPHRYHDFADPEWCKVPCGKAAGYSEYLSRVVPGVGARQLAAQELQIFGQKK
jgi:hypothetical protein